MVTFRRGAGRSLCRSSGTAPRSVPSLSWRTVFRALMKRRSCSLLTLLAITLSGCADFERERAAFCQRNPERCGLASGGPSQDSTPPIITGSSQPTASVSELEAVSLSATAQDEESPELEFRWTASDGVLGAPSSTGTASEVKWTAPSCKSAAVEAFITVTVTNAAQLPTSKVFTLVVQPCQVLAVSTRGNHSLGLLSNGTVWAWGSNSAGQLGDGTALYRLAPVQVSRLSNVTALAAGTHHSLALDGAGTVWSWGLNSHGRLGDRTAASRLTPGKVPDLPSIKALAAGEAHSLALDNDGKVWAWGSNSHGQLGDGTTTDRFAPVQVPGLTTVIALAAGDSYSLALLSDRTVRAWGLNSHGQLGDGTDTDSPTAVSVSGLFDVKALAAGASHSLALRESGSVWAWGSNNDGQLGKDASTAYLSQAQVIDLAGVTRLAAGDSHSLAVRVDGTVWAWGRNAEGQLGDGRALTIRQLPAVVPGLPPVTALVGGSAHSLALLGDGTLQAWGSNGQGQLGDGTEVSRPAPLQVRWP
jgi:alpha-tubulin suppressor-like RCC1 family protein